MTVLTPAQLATVLKAGGFTGTALVKSIAIALAESSGNDHALNDNPKTGDLSYGILQINMRGDMGPARRKSFGISSNEDLFDPVTNARAGYKLSNSGKSFSPWSTYKSGAYQKYMPAATKAAANPASVDNIAVGKARTDPSKTGSGIPVVGGLVDAVNAVGAAVNTMATGAVSVGKFADALLKLALPTNMMRLLIGLTGMLFIFLGIAIMGREVKRS